MKTPICRCQICGHLAINDNVCRGAQLHDKQQVGQKVKFTPIKIPGFLFFHYVVVHVDVFGKWIVPIGQGRAIKQRNRLKAERGEIHGFIARNDVVVHLHPIGGKHHHAGSRGYFAHDVALWSKVHRIVINHPVIEYARMMASLG